MSDKRGIPWIEIVQYVRESHNGVMRVDLYFGHDGDNVCRFGNYESMATGKWLAEGCSGRTMQEAVEFCYHNWYVNNQARIATGSEWESFQRGLGL